MQKLKREVVRRRLNDLNLKIFTSNDLEQIFGASKQASQSFLSYNSQNNYLTRLRKRYYCFSEEIPHDFLIANKIYSPSYISLASALSFHNLIPETVYSVTSITTKKTQEFIINEKQFVYRSIKNQGYFGYKTYQVNGIRTTIATPEKALADYTYYQLIDGGEWNNRIRTKNIDKKQLYKYLKRLGGSRLLSFWKKHD